MASIVLNKNNFFSNLDIIADKTKSKDKIALVLKDNAYGHGLCEMAALAQEYGITKAVVRSQKDAQLINRYFEYILVLSELPNTADPKIHYTINSLVSINEFPPSTKVELKVNSGMNRNGIEAEELEEAFALIKEKNLQLKAVFTHHACADEEGGFYDQQTQKFAEIKTKAQNLAAQYGYEIGFHSANSAALFRTKTFEESFARVGIAAYGCLEMPESLCSLDLKPVLSVYALKNSTRVVQAGESVCYGASFTAEEETRVSNYDFGYGDGFLRVCSNIYKTPENVAIAGRISMDNSSFFSEENKLLIFNDARDVAKFAGTISYEVLTSLKAHLSREVV